MACLCLLAAACSEATALRSVGDSLERFIDLSLTLGKAPPQPRFQS